MALRTRGHKTLLVDLDPQASATKWMGRPLTSSLAEWFQKGGERRIEPLIEADVIGSGPDLSSVPPGLSQKHGAPFILARGLRQVERAYDWIVLDTPPGENLLVSNALFAAERLIVPVQPASPEGIVAVLHLVEESRALIPGVRVAELGGIILAMTKHARASSTTLEAITKKYRGALLEPQVPHTSAVWDAWDARRPLSGSIGGRATEAYEQITEQLLQRARRWRR
jgi:chromosome partitioning protein